MTIEKSGVMIEIKNLRKYISEGRIFATEHAAERFHQRGIDISDIVNAVNNGEIIEQYLNDYPYPSCLVLGKSVSGENLHAVLSDNGTSSKIITAYFPDVDKWNDDFRIRR